MKQKLLFIFFAAVGSLLYLQANAQAKYESAVLEDAFVNETAAQADIVQNDGIGTLYLKNQASGQRETFFKISLNDLDYLTAAEVNLAKVELRYYSFRTNSTANINAISVYPADNTWNETTLTWTNSRTIANNAIAAGAIATATGVRIAGYSGTGQQGTAGATDDYNAANVTKIDISSYAIQQYKLGNKTISVILHVTAVNNNGDQQIANRELDTSVSDYDLKIPKVIISKPAIETVFGGNCEASDRQYWTEFGASGLSGGTNDALLWGWTGGGSLSATQNNEFAPSGFGSDGFLVACEDWSNSTVYKITQPVYLYAGTSYDIEFDYTIFNFSAYTGKVYLGTTTPTSAIYTDNLIGSFMADGSTTGDNNKQHFNQQVNIETSGAYYLVIEWANTGSNGYFNTSMDNITLQKVITPVPNFNAPAVGFVNNAVQFTNTSANATSYAWDFGDGATSTDANPSHTYSATGNYTVSLTINGNAAYTISKAITICVLRNETLAGGNMELADMTEWNIVGSTTFGGGSATWGNTTPSSFGANGYLYLQETNGTATQYYIWQAVQLESGGRYILAFDYMADNFRKAWGEVYIGTAYPGGSDYSDGGSRGAKPMSWADAEGTLTTGQYTYTFDCPANGVYFFVIKTGTNGNGKFLFGIDNVSLTKILDPVADFSASAKTTWINLPVTFTNASLNAVSSEWNFGDGANATDENPTHAYSAAGNYTVTLTVTGNGAQTDVKTLNIKVLDINDERIADGDMESSANWAEFGGVSNGTNSQLVWGDLPNAARPESYKPAGFGSDGFLTVAEDWNSNTAYKIAQAVQLYAGEIYKISFDYSVGSHRRAWFQVFADTSVPTDADYTNNQLGEGLIAWSTDYSGYGGDVVQHYAEDFAPAADGVYYLVIKWGCGAGDNGYFNTSIDNVKLEKVVDFVIAANETKTKTEYENGAYSNIVICSTDAATGALDLQGQSLTVKGVVKLQKTVSSGRWYAIGFPFDVDSIYTDATSYTSDDLNPLLPYDANGYPQIATNYYGDFWLKKYAYGNPAFEFTTETLAADTGYIIQFCDDLNASNITFVSEINPTLNAGALHVDADYKLSVNPDYQTLTLTQGENGGSYYYKFNVAANAFEKAQTGTLYLLPFESVITVSTNDYSSLRSSFATGDITGITPRATTDAIVSVRCYNLQGILMATGEEQSKLLPSGVYIVSKILKSGKTITTKELRIKN